MGLLRCPRCRKANRTGPVARGTPRCGSCGTDLPWVVDADDGDFAEESAASVPVLVDFWAPWCAPCRRVSPALERLAERHARRLKLVKVNVDEAPALADRFGVRSIPTLALLREGRELDRVTGALPEPQLERWLARHV